jgi:hypothetical protein
MSIPRTIALLVAAAILLNACATTPRVFTNEAPNAQFDRYRTYAYAEKLGTDNNADVRSLLSQYLIIEVSRQLDSRGYQQVETDADVIVDFALVTKEKLRSTPSTSLGGFYGYGPYPGYGYYGNYGGGQNITQYTEGTLSVAVVDRRTMSVAWEGINISRITDAVRENMGGNAAVVIDEIFARFPYRAAGGATSLAKNQ